MVAQEEKKRCLSELIEMAARPDREAAALGKLYDLLLRDSNGGKLYKSVVLTAKDFL